MDAKLIKEAHDFGLGLQCRRCGVTMADIAVQDSQPGCKGFVPACIPPLMGPARIGHVGEMTLIDATIFAKPTKG